METVHEQERDNRLRVKGWTLFREYHPWGKNDCYRHRNGAIVFYDKGRAYGKIGMYRLLLETWTPSRNDILDTALFLKRYFMV